MKQYYLYQNKYSYNLISYWMKLSLDDQGHFYQHRLALIPAWIIDDARYKAGVE